MPEHVSSDPQGSMWRRWDPHIHFPGTLFNDQFDGTTVAEALGILAKRQPSIEAIGVTDYFTSAGFRTIAAEWEKGAGYPIKYIFPNVELRLDIPTAKGHGVNLHLLCPPEDVDGLDRFLGSLEFSWNDRTYRADHGGLVDLGRAFTSNRSLPEDVALREGAKQFKVSFESLRAKFQSDSWAKEHCLVALAGGQGDGSSGVRSADGSFVARRQSIERFAQIIFSSNPQQTDFWHGLGADSLQRLNETYGGPKLCVHGSDAHDVATLGVCHNDRFTWLKGDPTFDTLRMACMSPATRSHIGPLPPTTGHAYGRIVRVTTKGPSWFTPDKVAVNPGLVAIIGARGSGKTALADLIAVGAGSDQPFANPASFVRRASPLLAGSIAEVEWSHGELSQRELNMAPWQDDRLDRGARYLSQQFVEQLCASDGVSDDLLREIEQVVFNSWPVDQRQGATQFSELLDIRLGAARVRQQAELDTIIELGEAITDQKVLQQELPRKRIQHATEEKTLEGLEAQRKQLADNATGDSADRLAAVSAVVTRRQEESQMLDRRITVLGELKQEVHLARTSRFPRYFDSLRQKYDQAALSSREWETFATDFVGNVDDLLDTSLANVRARREVLTGPAAAAGQTFPVLDDVSPTSLAERTLAELLAEQGRLERLVGLDVQRARKLTKLNEQSTAAQARSTKLKGEIKQAERAAAEIARMTSERVRHYAAYFDALLEEERQLAELYAPLKRVLDEFGHSVAKLRFSVKRHVDIRKWAMQGEEYLDLRKAGKFRGTGELYRIAADKLGPIWGSGDGVTVAEAIRAFSAQYSQDFRQHSPVERGDSAAYREWERNIARWLYGAEHVSLSYTLEYDGLSIERLSPGSRGIVLLLLYLAVDQEETDPLIIDQPEENLDPESVYSELVELFRNASGRRQIIMVTHNANLVVNTDVDQVIVARCTRIEEGTLPEIQYLSGGLEDPNIRLAVCEVLEGGAEAFRQRARRLRIALGA